VIEDDGLGCIPVWRSTDESELLAVAPRFALSYQDRDPFPGALVGRATVVGDMGLQ